MIKAMPLEQVKKAINQSFNMKENGSQIMNFSLNIEHKNYNIASIYELRIKYFRKIAQIILEKIKTPMNLEIASIKRDRNMKLINTILICLISGQIFGTAQIPDFLIYEDDTLDIYSNPLEGYFDKKGMRTIGEIDFEKGSHCTALWRGYVGTWKIENDSLFLVSIEADYCSGTPIELNISEEFGNKRIFANWVSYEVINPFGKQIKYIHQGYESIYEYERGFEFTKGELVRINNYDNGKSRESDYSKELEILHKFLFNNINWNLVESQKLVDKRRVIARFKVGENGKPLEVEIMRGVNPEIDKEAKRIINLIPNWDVYYRRGKIVETQWTLPIIFEKEFYEQK